MVERTIHSTDNRDLTTTLVRLDNYPRIGNDDWIEVNPCDLFQNALANAGMTQGQFDQAITHLDMILEGLHELGADPNDPNGHDDHIELVSGIERILQGLKVEGSEFT